MNIFRKIRLAYALQYRGNKQDSILYKIRNGKSYATTFSFSAPHEAKAMLDLVLESIATEMNVKDKRVYIPPYMTCAVPATEKQFTGNYPSGSYVTVPHDMIAGIYWEDVNGHRIDLDLSVIATNNVKYGWDADYRNPKRNILFSGDVTAAPNGATELFYVQRQQPTELIMFVNNYHYNSDIEVPFRIMVAQEQATNFDKNYTINPNNVLTIAHSTITKKQKILGLISVTPQESRLYFSETYLGNSITSGSKEYVTQGREYLSNFYKNAISLNELLTMAGAVLVNNRKDCDIDLSPDALERDTIINLLG